MWLRCPPWHKHCSGSLRPSWTLESQGSIGGPHKWDTLSLWSSILTNLHRINIKWKLKISLHISRSLLECHNSFCILYWYVLIVSPFFFLPCMFELVLLSPFGAQAQLSDLGRFLCTCSVRHLNWNLLGLACLPPYSKSPALFPLHLMLAVIISCFFIYTFLKY